MQQMRSLKPSLQRKTLLVIFCGSFVFSVFLFLSALSSLSVNDPNDGLRPHRISIVARSRMFSLLVDDVEFDQPWALADITVVNNINFFENRTYQRYIFSDFTYSPGLGNLMFQYASLRAIAKRNNARVVLPVSCKLRRAFALDAVFADDSIVEDIVRRYFYRRIDFQECCRYYPQSDYKLFASPDRYIEVLTGYFQSYRYFHPGQEFLIRREFRFLPGVIAEAKANIQSAQLERMLPDAVVKNDGDEKDEVVFLDETQYKFVGIHIRRGIDLTLDSRNAQHGHTVATKEYFAKAMQYFRTKYDRVIFIVASDNQKWATDNIRSKINGEIYFLKTHKREIDMAALSLCNYTILSTGTFSWWAGYLANGETVYYSDWPRPGSVMDQMVQKKDFFLDNWIPMH